ncbi:PTS glucitol/sorbitol transporter subunit IIA [Staphylococcus americanisciuri]|uniref:PTS glucitol/sorbitol transporter subunit IIA n=1 Tax=Staphylococcus americanisciuri TaxID=2973940 RepID=A0ABT2F0C3_9STAP|nr:PTS glucitol/sorbitol transporter subunit IIA [Staphylococcus americanisciuri]MCS4485888.1 PTS glucitol/sorbitol transporter subunit IIA [Staphylococcus americanisciuri]
MYQTQVKSIGVSAEAFLQEKMVILFGENAPQELIDFCYIIQVNNVESINEAQRLYVDGAAYRITKVGKAVEKNLKDLGHITLKFDGSTVAEQSGTLYLEDKEVPAFKEGTIIEIK